MSLQKLKNKDFKSPFFLSHDCEAVVEQNAIITRARDIMIFLKYLFTFKSYDVKMGIDFKREGDIK